MTDQRLMRLREVLADSFSEDELRTLCFDLGVNYDALPATGTAGKARELVLALGKQGWLPELVAYVRQARPALAVDDLPPSITADSLAALSALSESAGSSSVSQTATGSYIAQASGPGATANVTVIYQGAQVSVPSPEAVQHHRAALKERLEKDARALWGGMSVYIQEEGATLPIEASPYQAGQLGPRENLLQMLRAADRLLVLGEPGSGKTVSLERLAWELCSGTELVVPVIVRLFHYAGTPLVEWVQASLQETGALRLDGEQALAAFLNKGETRCFFLFDGLNEVAPPYRDRLADELARWSKNYPRHPVTLTSRSQDELWRRLRDVVGRAVVVQLISDEQARAYLVAHLDQKGAQFYERLDERLRALARTPLLLWMLKRVGAEEEPAPRTRGELYTRFVSGMLRRRDWYTDRHMDAEIPEWAKQEVQLTAMSDLAYHLGQGQRLACSRDEAMEVVARRLEKEQAKRVVEACARQGLLAGKESVWFAPHQTVQEHFAARALLELVKREQSMSWDRRLWWGIRRWLMGREAGLAALAANDWWMETFVQLAGLVGHDDVGSDDAAWLVREVARVNPWLALWCVEEGRAVDEGTRASIEGRSAKLLQSPRVTDRRRAVQTLARMRSERVMRPLLRAAADDDSEAAGLAVQALVDMGEVVRTLIVEALGGADRHLRRGALRYLAVHPDDLLCQQIPWENILGQPMVWVPLGPFLMGSDKQRDWQAYDNELPRHTVTLPGYWIGRYPVTVAQFRAFVKESGLKPADQASLKGPDDHPVVNVNWHDAIAYCQWLSEKTGVPVTLPSEAEWEKAARGTDGRIYPWGNEFDKNRCNTGESRSVTTTPVGKYSPQGDSPYGCGDMAGNVFEWTRSLFKPYPCRADDGREDLSSSGTRVLRGGSFYNIEGSARAASRYGDFSLNHDRDYGFRVGVSAPFSPTFGL